jgi:hypothetical protein
VNLNIQVEGFMFEPRQDVSRVINNRFEFDDSDDESDIGDSTPDYITPDAAAVADPPPQSMDW